MVWSVKNDLAGRRFERLSVLHLVPGPGSYSEWLVQCDCGKRKVVLGQSMVRGLTSSCGCLWRDLPRGRHGHAGGRRHRSYRIWAGMMDRCEWGGHPSYRNYGARGIRVAPEWHDYEQFLKDMGSPPDGTSIDRIDNDGPYSRDNCRWATRRQQALNTSRTIRISIGGQETTLVEFCESHGLSRSAVRSRAFRNGKDYVKALRSMGFDVQEANCAVEE